MSFHFARRTRAAGLGLARLLQAAWRRLNHSGARGAEPHGFGLLVDLHGARR